MADDDWGQPWTGGTGWNENKEGKIVPPKLPDAEDTVALCKWVSTFMCLSPEAPVNGVSMYSTHGRTNLTIHRAGGRAFQDIEISNAEAVFKTVNAFQSMLVWGRSKKDPEPWGYSTTAISKLALALRWIAETDESVTRMDETEQMLQAFVASGIVLEGYTVAREREDMLDAIRAFKDKEPSKEARKRGDVSGVYMVDYLTSMTYIRVEDLKMFARRFVEGSLGHGDVDNWIREIHWKRRVLRASEEPHRRGKVRGRQHTLPVFYGHLDVPGV
jgi:hypothetical protein